MKYCGIADEYKMLRDRWLYLHDKMSILPHLRGESTTDKKTFKVVDVHVKRLDDMFSSMKFSKFEMEERDNFKPIPLEKYDEIVRHFLELSTYIGLLKLAFFQRTVSAEISHVASGIPHSPERTIGNELFYLAADKIIDRYIKCINAKDNTLKWDGFITFAPPPPEFRRGFHGALCIPYPIFNLFHVSMSEEQKYFVGTYLILAHELAHSIIIERSLPLPLGYNYTRWYFTLQEGALEGTKNYLKNFIREKHCKGCSFYRMCPFCPSKFDPEPIRPIFEQYICDLIAFKIAGPNTLHALLDITISSNIYSILDMILRIISILAYLHSEPTNIHNITTKDITPVLDRLISLLSSFKGKINNRCLRCWVDIGNFWGRTTYKFDKQTYRKLSHTNNALFSDIIKENFVISKNTSMIKNFLLKGKPCTGKDPRYILHAYYEAYRQSKGKDRPNYAATIYSLAFNKWNKK